MEKIREMRLLRGFTQRELADKLSVRQPSVAMWETGASMPRADRLPALARALNCRIGDLFDAGDGKGGAARGA